jgi:hypothetical protein
VVLIPSSAFRHTLVSRNSLHQYERRTPVPRSNTPASSSPKLTILRWGFAPLYAPQRYPRQLILKTRGRTGWTSVCGNAIMSSLTWLEMIRTRTGNMPLNSTISEGSYELLDFLNHGIEPDIPTCGAFTSNASRNDKKTPFNFTP